MIGVYHLEKNPGYFCSMMDSLHSPEHITITADLNFKSIQQAFNYKFPFLKIEFFTPASGTVQKPAHISPDRKLASFLENGNSFVLELNEIMTVLDLQHLLAEKLAVEAQVYRKAGSVWVETLLTDHWTLGLQNEEGKHFSMP